MNLEINSKVGARFKFITRKASTNKITKETDWFHNIVLDSGLAQMSQGTWVNRCCVGTGNSEPVATQTQLDSFVASTTTVQDPATGMQITTLPYYLFVRRAYRFGGGVAAGNISEVGLGWANNALWNRALIRDNNGNPTTITVLPDEFLDVIAEIRSYPQESISGSFNFLNKAGAVISTHNYSGRAFYTLPQHTYSAFKMNSIGIYSGSVGAIPTAIPTGTRLGYGVATTTEYPTQTAIKCTKKFLLAEAIGEHKTLFVQQEGFLNASAGSGYQVEFTPSIQKTNQMELTYTVSMSWGRYVA